MWVHLPHQISIKNIIVKMIFFNVKLFDNHCGPPVSSIFFQILYVVLLKITLNFGFIRKNYRSYFFVMIYEFYYHKVREIQNCRWCFKIFLFYFIIEEHQKLHIKTALKKFHLLYFFKRDLFKFWVFWSIFLWVR